MSECLSLQSRQAAEREGLRLVKEEAMRLMNERDTALADTTRNMSTSDLLLVTLKKLVIDL